MIFEAMVFFRGPDAKSRLGIKAGGPLTEAARQQLAIALLTDIVGVLESSGIFVAVHVGVSGEEAFEFVDNLGLSAIALRGDDATQQIKAASAYEATRCDGYLLIAADLPFISKGYLMHLIRRAGELTESQGQGVVFGVSRGLGAASIVLSPPGVAEIELGVGPTFLNNGRRLGLAGIPYATVVALEGYWDLDTPADLYETAVLHSMGGLVLAPHLTQWLDHHGSCLIDR